MSQKIQFFLIVCIAIATGALVFSALQPQASTVQEITIVQPEERSITVGGEGEVKARPDTVEFVIVVETTDKELPAAKIQNEKIALEIMNILQNHEIANKDINSDYLRVKTDAAGTRIYKYIVDKLIKVTLHDLAEMEPLFTDIQKTGVVQITEIHFSISQIQLYREQALQLAIQEAEKKAEIMARKAGMEIGKPFSIEENPVYRYGNQSPETFSMDNLNIDYVFETMNSVAFAEITIEAQVTIKFELK